MARHGNKEERERVRHTCNALQNGSPNVAPTPTAEAPAGLLGSGLRGEVPRNRVAARWNSSLGGTHLKFES